MKEFYIENNPNCREAIKAHAERLGYSRKDPTYQGCENDKHWRFSDTGTYALIYPIFTSAEIITLDQFFAMTPEECQDRDNNHDNVSRFPEGSPEVDWELTHANDRKRIAELEAENARLMSRNERIQDWRDDWRDAAINFKTKAKRLSALAVNRDKAIKRLKSQVRNHASFVKMAHHVFADKCRECDEANKRLELVLGAFMDKKLTVTRHRKDTFNVEIAQ